jgi:SnoaL-like polyketide cyclase
MPDTKNTAELWQQWADLWNGKAGASELAAPELTVHAALIDGSPSSALRGPDGLAAMIAQIRAAFPDLTFTTEVGPLRDGDFLIGRWRADGHYAGGFPGATAAAGTPRSPSPAPTSCGCTTAGWSNTGSTATPSTCSGSSARSPDPKTGAPALRPAAPSGSARSPPHGNTRSPTATVAQTTSALRNGARYRQDRRRAHAARRHARPSHRHDRRRTAHAPM